MTKKKDKSAKKTQKIDNNHMTTKKINLPKRLNVIFVR